MMQQSENQLKTAFVLLQCDKKHHDECKQIRDALVSAFPNIRKAHVTNAHIRGERWCVAATALVQKSDESAFEKSLWNLTTKTSRPIGVNNLHIITDDQ